MTHLRLRQCKTAACRRQDHRNLDRNRAGLSCTLVQLAVIRSRRIESRNLLPLQGTCKYYCPFQQLICYVQLNLSS